jgi:hypothetical protein
MPRRPVLRAAAAGAFVAALALPAAAFAGTLTHADPAQDVQKITATASGTTITDAPDNKTADLVHLTSAYGRQRLLEKVRLRDLAGHWFLSSRIKTATTHFDLVLIHQSGGDQIGLTKGKRQTQVVCDGLLPNVDRTHHTVSVTVPADCLNAPHWVQIGVGIVKLGKAGGISFADDALRRRGIAEANLTLSRRIHQG